MDSLVWAMGLNCDVVLNCVDCGFIFVVMIT